MSELLQVEYDQLSRLLEGCGVKEVLGAVERWLVMRSISFPSGAAERDRLEAAAELVGHAETHMEIYCMEGEPKVTQDSRRYGIS